MLNVEIAEGNGIRNMTTEKEMIVATISTRKKPCLVLKDGSDLNILANFTSRENADLFYVELLDFLGLREGMI